MSWLGQVLEVDLVFWGASTERGRFDEVARRERVEDGRADKAAEELVVHLVWEVRGEDFREIGGNVGGGGDKACGREGWGREDEGEGKDASFLGDEDEGVLDHALCAGELVDVAEDWRVVLVGRDGSDSAGAGLDEANDVLEGEVSRLGRERREGRGALEAGEDGNVEELVVGDDEVCEDGGLGGERDGGGGKVDVEDDAVDSVEHEELVGAVHGVDVGAVVTLEVDELSPGEVGGDDKLDASLLEEAVDHAHHVGGDDGGRGGELLLRLGEDAPLLVVLPRGCPPPRLWFVCTEGTLVVLGGDAIEDEDGLDACLLERLEVTLNLGAGKGRVSTRTDGKYVSLD